MPPANEPHCMFVTMLTRSLVVLIVFCEARSRIVRLASRSYIYTEEQLGRLFVHQVQTASGATFEEGGFDHLQSFT